MVEVNTKQFMYLYGKFYDNFKERSPDPESHYDIIVYNGGIQAEGRVIGSLEGIFISKNDLFEDIVSNENLLVRRDQMKVFENQYEGTFVPFSQGGRK